MRIKAILAVVVSVILLGVAGVATLMIVLSSDLPKMIKVEDYEPLLVTQVYDRNGEKIGEFFREKRILVPYDQIPKHLVQAFISAEDSSFFQHSGINFTAIFRAAIANLRAGRRVQGGSTITQQVARSILLGSNEKTYTRKIKEAILAYRMETNLRKEEILYLYLNQIYLGQGAYGVGAAAEVYFRKPVSEITVGEAALLAGLPQAPSRYSPISNPSSAKSRQKYVLNRMAEEGYITDAVAKETINTPLPVYVRKDYTEKAPYYLETVRLMLVQKLDEATVLDKGLKVYTGLDLPRQEKAQNEVRNGLRELDKRQGYRGALKNLEDPKEIAQFLVKSRDELMEDHSPLRIINPDGTIDRRGPLNLTGKDESGNDLPNLPEYIKKNQIVEGVVTKVDDNWGLTYIRFAESKGIIDIDTMKWASKPLADGNHSPDIGKPSEALKKGDIVQIKVIGEKFSSGRINDKLKALNKGKKGKTERPKDLPLFDDYAELGLEQEPQAEAALVSIDQKTNDILAMVGGYDFQKSEFNRAIQAARQTGSAFKTLVYTAALDKGYTPGSLILDAPVVFEEQVEEGQATDEMITKRWKPTNHGDHFTGEILFRNALIKSLNVPTVKIIEDIGVEWVAKYARRLGIFSPLNMDFTLALGSSGITVYQMTRAFAELGKMGQKVDPIVIHKVEDQQGNLLAEDLSMDSRFEAEVSKVQEEIGKWKEDAQKESERVAAEATTEQSNPDKKSLKSRKYPPFFFEDPNPLVKPTTAYLITSILQGVIEEPGGTGGGARSIGRPAAGKTGTTNGYFDAWFVGYTPDIATGVWVGFDEEKTLGHGEVGGRAALPIWLEYMKFAHQGIPVRNFPVPDGIVFANIDNETGQLASASSQNVVRQAFQEGTEPQEVSNGKGLQEDQDFFKQDMSE
ncbi:MAG: PBP1A family penicillin-binding protein [Bdellovibrionales bacterium]|nr:PBP1A family penicillin-binding protein [Bdellovibrionales bacterium]